MIISIMITALCAYLIGAIPTGYLIAQLKGIADIRAHGSGNIGATNVSRFLGLHYFFLIFLLDAGKAFLFIYAITPYFPLDYLYCFASILLFGNGCSVFLRGSGGKGVATLLGLLAALEPQAIPFLLGIWIIALVLTRTIGIASVVAVASLPCYVYMTTDNNSFFIFSLNHTPFYLFSLFATTLILLKHRSNIRAFWKTQCSSR